MSFLSRKKYFHIFVVLLMPFILILFSTFMGSKIDEQQLKTTEQAIQRAALQCYALEGFYPSSLEYLTHKYGVKFDSHHIFVHYQYIASNLAPDITVLPIRQSFE